MEENENQILGTESQDQDDPWAVAFAALDKETAEAIEPNADQGEHANTDEADHSAGSDGDEGGDSEQIQDTSGGSDNLGGESSEETGDSQEDLLGVSEDDIESYRQSVVEDVETRTIQDVAKAYIQRGARHTNGKLGATIEDADICKRDSDGVPHFYNPDTGKEFTGDNPRRQAQEWVDDYNKQLAANFNATCHDYSAKLLEEQAPTIAVLEFAPTYDKLDPVRKSMFDNLVSDYEIKDQSGDVIGYSCDLNKAMEAVNRQVRAIQSMQKPQDNQVGQVDPLDTNSGGPALDMKTSSGAVPPQSDGKPKFKNLAEAMEWEQDQLLASMKKGN